ncbi:MAG: hypothetical protein P8Z69_09215, partial [Acidihalobacter sp.]
APGDFFFEMRKETGERNAPQDRLSLSGNLANAPLNGARSYWPSRPRAAWLTSLSAIPAQAHVREASDQGGTERQNNASLKRSTSDKQI